MAERRSGGGEEWQLIAKGMTGDQINLTVAKPQGASVLEVKGLIHQREPKLPPHQQRLIYQAAGQQERSKLDDARKLASYPGLGNGSTLFLVRLSPCEVYVQDVHGRQHTLIVPSSEPQSYTVALMRQLYEKQTGQSMDVYQFQFRGRPVVESRANAGRGLTLGDYGIKANDTLVVTKMGFILDVSNPQVDLCFMVDCTGSMQQWIDTVKNNVKDMRDKLDSEYRGCDLRFAFVRYTDYDQPASTRTTHIDFTKSQSAFHTFVSAIQAGGGGDGPEDIMGGLKSALYSLTWRNSATKVLIHIADCPCHGRQYHTMSDTYPSGDPAGITHEQMMGEVAHREVQYWFGYIQKGYTDAMIAIFNESLRRLSDNCLMIRQFDAIQPAEVGEAMHRAVTASIYAKEAAKASVRSFSLDASIPNWSSPVPPEQHGKKTPAPGVFGLKHLEDDIFTQLEGPSIPFSFKCAANPFADGEETIVFHAYDTTNRRQVVLKQFKREEGAANSLECYMKVLEVREVAAVYAREFNTDKQKPSLVDNIEFAHVDIVQCTQGGCYILQPFISGKFEKFNNNMGIVCTTSPYSQTLQAFSHFTWEKSGRTTLICDLQGVWADGRLLLTDPAIHSRCDKGGTFGNTDLGYAGIQRFFNSHHCSDICQMMRLKPFST